MSTIKINTFFRQVTSESGTASLEVVAQGCPRHPGYTSYFSGETAPTTAGASFPCVGKRAVILRALTLPEPVSGIFYSYLYYKLYNADEDIIYADNLYITQTDCYKVFEGKNEMKLMALGNEVYGATTVKLDILSITGELHLQIAAF